MQSVVAPFARYFVKENGKWTSVLLEVWRRLHKRSVPGRGVLELFAQSVDVALAHRDGTKARAGLLVEPKFLANGRASTIFAAVDGSTPGLDVESIKALAEQVRFVFLSENPDQCSANRRKRVATEHMFADCKNIMCAPLPGCGVHILHRVLEGATRSEKFIGEVHATSYIMTHVTHRNTMLHTIYDIIEKELEYVTDEDADPAWAGHKRDVLECLGACCAWQR